MRDDLLRDLWIRDRKLGETRSWIKAIKRASRTWGCRCWRSEAKKNSAPKERSLTKGIKRQKVKMSQVWKFATQIFWLSCTWSKLYRMLKNWALHENVSIIIGCQRNRRRLRKWRGLFRNCSCSGSEWQSIWHRTWNQQQTYHIQIWLRRWRHSVR